MKTVIDAVNEFKGEWPDSLAHVAHWKFGNNQTLSYDGSHVCNKDDFISSAHKSKYGVACFDLMFYGCQTINAPQAIELLEAIEAGKIHGVTFTGES